MKVRPSKEKQRYCEQTSDSRQVTSPRISAINGSPLTVGKRSSMDLLQVNAIVSTANAALDLFAAKCNETTAAFKLSIVQTEQKLKDISSTTVTNSSHSRQSHAGLNGSRSSTIAPEGNPVAINSDSFIEPIFQESNPHQPSAQRRRSVVADASHKENHIPSPSSSIPVSHNSNQHQPGEISGPPPSSLPNFPNFPLPPSADSTFQTSRGSSNVQPSGTVTSRTSGSFLNNVKNPISPKTVQNTIVLSPSIAGKSSTDARSKERALRVPFQLSSSTIFSSISQNDSQTILNGDLPVSNSSATNMQLHRNIHQANTLSHDNFGHTMKFGSKGTVSQDSDKRILSAIYGSGSSPRINKKNVPKEKDVELNQSSKPSKSEGTKNSSSLSSSATETTSRNMQDHSTKLQYGIKDAEARVKSFSVEHGYENQREKNLNSRSLSHQFHASLPSLDPKKSTSSSELSSSRFEVGVQQITKAVPPNDVALSKENAHIPSKNKTTNSNDPLPLMGKEKITSSSVVHSSSSSLQSSVDKAKIHEPSSVNREFGRTMEANPTEILTNDDMKDSKEDSKEYSGLRKRKSSLNESIINNIPKHVVNEKNLSHPETVSLDSVPNPTPMSSFQNSISQREKRLKGTFTSDAEKLKKKLSSLRTIAPGRNLASSKMVSMPERSMTTSATSEPIPSSLPSSSRLLSSTIPTLELDFLSEKKSLPNSANAVSELIDTSTVANQGITSTTSKKIPLDDALVTGSNNKSINLEFTADSSMRIVVPVSKADNATLPNVVIPPSLPATVLDFKNAKHAMTSAERSLKAQEDPESSITSTSSSSSTPASLSAKVNTSTDAKQVPLLGDSTLKATNPSSKDNSAESQNSGKEASDSEDSWKEFIYTDNDVTGSNFTKQENNDSVVNDSFSWPIYPSKEGDDNKQAPDQILKTALRSSLTHEVDELSEKESARTVAPSLLVTSPVISGSKATSSDPIVEPTYIFSANPGEKDLLDRKQKQTAEADRDSAMHFSMPVIASSRQALENVKNGSSDQLAFSEKPASTMLVDCTEKKELSTLVPITSPVNLDNYPSLDSSLLNIAEPPPLATENVVEEANLAIDSDNIDRELPRTVAIVQPVTTDKPTNSLPLNDTLPTTHTVSENHESILDKEGKSNLEKQDLVPKDKETVNQKITADPVRENTTEHSKAYRDSLSISHSDTTPVSSPSVKNPSSLKKFAKPGIPSRIENKSKIKNLSISSVSFVTQHQNKFKKPEPPKPKIVVKALQAAGRAKKEQEEKMKNRKMAMKATATKRLELAYQKKQKEETDQQRFQNLRNLGQSSIRKSGVTPTSSTTTSSSIAGAKHPPTIIPKKRKEVQSTFGNEKKKLKDTGNSAHIKAPTPSSSSSSYSSTSSSIAPLPSSSASNPGMSQKSSSVRPGGNVSSTKVCSEATPVSLPDIPSESDTDNDGAEKLPEWARSPQIRLALSKQESLNPDTIFGGVQHVQVDEIFPSRDRKRRPRTPSSYWSGTDALTQEEEERYHRFLGFKKNAS